MPVQLGICAARVPSVPDYELLRRIGGGAYGEVWLARSQATGVLRAAKIVWRHKFEDDRPFEREFEGIQKFERISREHPSQLALFHIGRNKAEGYFYYVMELADALQDAKGEALTPEPTRDPKCKTIGLGPTPFDLEGYVPHTLRAELDQGRLPAARVLAIGLALTEALHHLHLNRLVHRDVKPSNVIFVNGRPKLADIGLVTDASDQCSIVGTEGYLPPEGPGTAQADIFSLGKVLYEAATGLDRRRFPDLPPDLKDWPDAPAVGELNEIVTKACATIAEQRYGNADAMHQEFARVTKGKSIRKARRFQQRKRVLLRALPGLAAVMAMLALYRFGGHSPGVAAGDDEPVSTNEVANTYFKLGKQHFDKFRGKNMKAAADCFQTATNADPHFAPAYGLLAATYFWGGEGWNPQWKMLPQAKSVAEQALALDGNLAEPYLALGWYYGMSEWDWKKALACDKHAVNIKGSYFCHLCYAELLRMAGKTKEALAEILKARDLNPQSRITNIRLAHYYICDRQYKRALDQVNQAAVMDETYDSSYDRTDAFLALGQPENALSALNDELINDGVSKNILDHEIAEAKGAMPREGVKVVWRLSLKHIEENDLYQRARCLCQLGKTKEAFSCLEDALNAHDVKLTFMIMTDWTLDPIRFEPRFRAMLHKMHFE